MHDNVIAFPAQAEGRAPATATKQTIGASIARLGALAGRPSELDPVFAAIDAFRQAKAAFEQVTADAEAALENGVCVNAERWDAQDRFHDEVFWPSLLDLISTPPATLLGLAALLAFVRESGGVLDFIGDNDENLALFDRAIERSVCALAGLPAPPAPSIHLQGQGGGEHA
ncbi:hypothetical protein [Bradyrhizobium viridifuturi]|uniref:hypothetical protein n=1 Tax=Bradyrhizobium viridifuturi TaxID=1654716 RepID=UPI00067F170E|nr:hypothetical protein [Bradyrhizobium viridifuturi]